MIEELRQVMEHAQHESEDMQRIIAEVVALLLEERAWDTLVSSPESQRVLAELAAEARAEMAAGTVRDLDELLDSISE